MCQELSLENIDETRNYFLEEIEQNKLVSRKQEKVCTTLNYIEHFLTLVFTVTGCVSISAFASLLVIPTWITNSAKTLKTCAMAAGIKKYKSIIKKKKKKYNKIISLAKSKLNSIEVLFSKALIEWNISNDEFVSINNVLKENGNMKEEIKSLKTKTVCLFIKQCYLIVKSVEKIQKVKIRRTKNGRVMILSKVELYHNKKSKFIK